MRCAIGMTFSQGWAIKFVAELSKPINNAQRREAFMKDDQRWSSFAFTHKRGHFL
jgi:hypothetical protein